VALTFNIFILNTKGLNNRSKCYLLNSSQNTLI